MTLRAENYKEKNTSSSIVKEQAKNVCLHIEKRVAKLAFSNEFSNDGQSIKVVSHYEYHR